MKTRKKFLLLVPAAYLLIIILTVTTLSGTSWMNFGFYDQSTPVLAIRYGTHLTKNRAFVEVVTGKYVPQEPHNQWMFTLSLKHLTFYSWCTTKLECGMGSYYRK